jgi:hypothetical protein
MKFPDAAIAPNVLDTLTGGLVAYGLETLAVSHR